MKFSVTLYRAAETYTAYCWSINAHPFPSVPNALSMENTFFFLYRLMKGLPILLYNILKRTMKTRYQCLMAKNIFLSYIKICFISTSVALRIMGGNSKDGNFLNVRDRW